MKSYTNSEKDKTKEYLIDFYKRLQANETDDEYWLSMRKEWADFYHDPETHDIAVKFGKLFRDTISTLYMVTNGILYERGELVYPSHDDEKEENGLTRGQ